MRRFFLGCLGLTLALTARDADATYSISAVDEDEMLVGGAGVSCVGALQVSVIQGTVPGVGVVHAQAALNEAGRDQAVLLMSMGSTAMEIIQAIASPSFDFNYQLRQYGVVLLPDDAFAFTGDQNGPFAGHQYGTVGPHRFTVQGNILTSENVVTQAKTGFETPDACDMAERLMLALEAGAENGEGDSRCTDDGIPADSGFLRIVNAAGEEILFIEVTNTAPENPVELLRQEFEAWRVDNPCPDLPGGFDESDTADAGDSADGDTTGGDGDGDVDTGSEAEASTDAGEASTTSSGTDAGSGESGAPETQGSSPDDRGDAPGPGCDCTQGGGGGWSSLALLGLLAWPRRRRSRAGTTRKRGSSRSL